MSLAFAVCEVAPGWLWPERADPSGVNGDTDMEPGWFWLEVQDRLPSSWRLELRSLSLAAAEDLLPAPP